MSAPVRQFRLARLTPHEATEAHAFHVAHVGEFLWPRTAEQFAKLVEDGLVYGARENGSIVGVCYVNDSDSKHPEFGGIYLHEGCRGLGVAKALAVASLAAYVVEHPPSEETELIAHVHEDNPDPRLLLEGLGFAYVRKTKPPRHVVPSSMKRNADGDVVGDVFLFSFDRCSALADALLKLTRDRRLKTSGPEFELAGGRFKPTSILGTLQALRDIGQSFKAKA